MVKCRVFNLLESELLIAHFSFNKIVTVKDVTRHSGADRQRVSRYDGQL